MKFISENTISEKLLNLFDEKMTFVLANRLEEENYMIPFDGLKDWQFLRTLVIKRLELKSKLYKSP